VFRTNKGQFKPCRLVEPVNFFLFSQKSDRSKTVAFLLKKILTTKSALPNGGVYSVKFGKTSKTKNIKRVTRGKK
jgi:hypothetical protein